MLTRIVSALLVAVLLTLVHPGTVAPVAAQGPEPVTITNPTDDLALAGLYYAAPEADSPAVLLMHHGGGRKEAWIDLIPLLQEAGYAALTVDLRGHGETGGTFTGDLAQEDAHLWLEWLRAQPDVDPEHVSIVSASLGADVGLQVMANDEQIVTLVALSVTLEFDGLNAKTAVETIGPRPLFLVAALGVENEADTVRTLVSVSQGEIQARLYDNTACCTFLMMFDRDLAPSIIRWLDQQN